MTERIPALTLHQPWAWAVIYGHKRIENRDWRTPYRGRLLIHAGKTFDVEAQAWIEETMDLELSNVYFPGGRIVGEATLTEITTDDDENQWAMPDMYHWHLADAKAYDYPIVARGMPGFWYPNAEAMRSVKEEASAR